MLKAERLALFIMDGGRREVYGACTNSQDT